MLALEFCDHEFKVRPGRKGVHLCPGTCLDAGKVRSWRDGRESTRGKLEIDFEDDTVVGNGEA